MTAINACYAFGGRLSQTKFPIKVDGCQYFLVLPDWESDYIQGMLAEKAVPYELPMLQAMRGMLNEGDLVLDIGANIGNHTFYLAAVVGCRVVAFEPNSILASPLQASIALNGLEGRVSLRRKGVGSAEAKAVFEESKPDNLGAQSLTLFEGAEPSDDDASAMDVVPLDSMKFEQPVRAIKIDVEGMELDVLKGAQRLIEKDLPSLFIESHNEEQFLLIHDFLEKWGYVYWRTFNATPTNWFLPSTEAAQANLQQHGLEQGKALYKLWDERQRLRKSFLDLREKHRVTNERLVELQKQLGEANAKKQQKVDANEPNAVASTYPDDAPVPDIEFSYGPDQAHPEQELGLDFSLPEERGKDMR